MNIADIDLDIFLDGVSAFGQGRRAPSTTRPWDEERLRRFLEDQCLLERDPPRRPRGRFVVRHDEAFPILEALSQNGARPLDLVHIDAHSDLGTGFGDLSWIDIGGRLLGLPPEERSSAVPRDGPERISPANYLSFALACRWLRSLTYVHHAHAGMDVMPFFFRDFDPGCGVMELRYVPHFCGDGSRDELRALPHKLEPPVPFERVQVDDYAAAKRFDFVILCQSPGYTPIEADDLIPIFDDYVDFTTDDSKGYSDLAVQPCDTRKVR